MKIRTKIFFGYLVIIALGFYSLQDWLIDDVKQNYLEAAEEMMVDTANMFACLASEHIYNNHLDVSAFDRAIKKGYKRTLKAQIYQLCKVSINLKMYITDKHGIVLYDSLYPENVGQDFSQWRDVKLTLHGKYGARATRAVPADPRTSVLHVAAPIYNSRGDLFGVLTVGKPVEFTVKFIETAQNKIITQTTITAVIVILLSIFISKWLTHPIKRLRDYAKAVRDGKKVDPPHYGGNNEIAQLTRAFEQMREALEGKKYVEGYVNNLTHELKSPLSAIKGAIELLDENNLPEEQKERFTTNIKNETERMRRIVDKMLQLSLLENRRRIDEPEDFDLVSLIAELVRSYECNGSGKHVMMQTEIDETTFSGDRLLIYQAIDNLVANATDFVPQEDGLVVISLTKTENKIIITIADNGPGIPDYAYKRIFEKFYSLPRPATKRKSSGLGLPLVKEIVELHKGTVELTSRTEGGTQAEISFAVEA